MAHETTRIWAAVKGRDGKVAPKFIDVEGEVPEEYFVKLHDSIRPFCFALWQNGAPPDDERQGNAEYALWWWDEDARRAAGGKPVGFPGKL